MKHEVPEIKLNVINGCVEYSVTDSWSAEFIGADFPQLVDDNLRVHMPLTDMNAVLSFKCKRGSETAERDVILALNGEFPSYGRKPNVIPEPAQWHKTVGILKNPRTYSCDEKLFETVKAFALELYNLTGIELQYTDNGDVSFEIDSRLDYLGNEGYEIECTKDSIKVTSSDRLGAVWAGKTICQLMVQGGFPCGIMRDYPRYSVRGFMLDVGRKPVSIKTLEKIADKMAWYKLNDFQLHLSDNYIWLEDYAKNGDVGTYDAYQAFRLESNLKNDKGETPTAKDYYYSKQEFSEFIKVCAEKGVRIIPEIDVPAHALAFTKVFPEYAVKNQQSVLAKKRPLTDHIDVSRPEAVDFIKRIFDEYIGTDVPVFPNGTDVHIGADEFLSDYGAYRRFINEIVPYIKKTNPVRMWGGLTWIKDNPETPIVKEAIENVEINLWNSNWADGREMYDMGYKLINTIDNLLYIVPNGTKIRAPYMDFINKSRAFKVFEPNSVRLKGGKYVKLPAGNKQMLGGCFAIWQDNIDKRSKGITEQDLYDRFIDSAAIMAEKNWGSCTDKMNIKAVNTAEKLINNAVPADNTWFKPINNISLDGGASFVETGCKQLNAGDSLCFSIKFNEIKADRIIMETDAPYGTYDLRITKNHKLGFTNENYEFEFDFPLEPNKKYDIVIDTKPLRTAVKSGRFKTKSAVGSFSFDGMVRNSGIKNSTLLIPTERIGSKTNSVNAEIYSIYVK